MRMEDGWRHVHEPCPTGPCRSPGAGAPCNAGPLPPVFCVPFAPKAKWEVPPPRAGIAPFRTHQNLPEPIPDPDVQLLSVGHIDEPALRHCGHLVQQGLVRGPDPHLLEAQPNGVPCAQGASGLMGRVGGCDSLKTYVAASLPGWPHERHGETSAPECLGHCSLCTADPPSGTFSTPLLRPPPLPISDPSHAWVPHFCFGDLVSGLLALGYPPTCLQREGQLGSEGPTGQEQGGAYP